MTVLNFLKCGGHGCAQIASSLRNSCTVVRIATAFRRDLPQAVLMLLAAGCQLQPAALPTGTVSGRVNLAGDALTEGRVNFLSEELGVGAGGDIQPDGTYSLEGPLPTASYKVFISFAIAPTDLGTSVEDVKKSVPEKYQNLATSPLTADVGVGVNEMVFDLE